MSDVTMIEPSVDLFVTAVIDDVLRLAERIRAEKPRDPMRALEDVLLDMRLEVQDG